MLPNTKEIVVENLLAEVGAIVPQGYRFVTMTCVDVGEQFDIIYHFDKNYNLYNLRLKLAKGGSLPSISPIFFAALLVENEIKDLFGVNVTGLAIDYEGRFLLSEGAPVAPQSKPCTPGVGMQVQQKKLEGN
jgi:NADH:ubiquinone oxidoreductase subunit C